MAGQGKKPIGIEQLHRYADELIRRANVLKAVSDSGKAKGIWEPEVMGQPMMDRSLKSIDGFILSCKRELGEL